MNSPVAMAFPANCAPGEQLFEKAERAWRKLFRHLHIDARQALPDSDITISDLAGSHVWYNVHTGSRLETVGLFENRWGALEPLPTPDELGLYKYNSPGLWVDGRYVIEHWVLADALTHQQVETWFRYGESYDARMKGMPTQMGLFVPEMSHADLIKEESAITEPLRFDYDLVDDAHRETVIDATIDIKRRERRAALDIVEIGCSLIAVRDLLPYGQFVPWIEQEFGWQRSMAYNFMAVAESFPKFGKVERFGLSALYTLSGPTVPDAAIEEANEIAASGEKVTHAVAKKLVAKHRQSVDSPSEAAHTNKPTGKCGVCGRPLSDPEHVAQGCGPVCAAKQAAATDPPLPPDFEDDLIILVECPQCGAQQQDLDGFGVLHCPTCGYCTHPSADGGICGICGEQLAPTEPEAELTPHQKRMADIRIELDFWRMAVGRLDRIGELTGIYACIAPLRRAIEVVLDLLARSLVIVLIVWFPLVMDGTGKTSSVACDGPGQPVCEVRA